MISPVEHFMFSDCITSQDKYKSILNELKLIDRSQNFLLSILLINNVSLTTLLSNDTFLFSTQTILFSSDK